MGLISATPLGRRFDEQSKKTVIKESSTKDEAHIVGLIDKEGNHWMHRSDLSRNAKNPNHTSHYPSAYKDASPGYIASMNKVHSAWHNKTTNQVHEGGPATTYGGGPPSGQMLTGHLTNGKFTHISHYDIHKKESKE